MKTFKEFLTEDEKDRYKDARKTNDFHGVYGSKRGTGDIGSSQTQHPKPRRSIASSFVYNHKEAKKAMFNDPEQYHTLHNAKYQHKDEVKAKGAEWDSDAKKWKIHTSHQNASELKQKFG